MIIGAFLYLIGLATQTLSDAQLENVIISLENDTVQSVIELYIYPEKPNWYVIIQTGGNTTLVKRKSKNAAEFDGTKLEHHGDSSLNNAARFFGNLKKLVSGVKHRVRKHIERKKKRVHDFMHHLVHHDRQSIRKKYEEVRNKYNRQSVRKKYEEARNHHRQSIRKKHEEAMNKYKTTTEDTKRVNNRISAAVNHVKRDAENRLKQIQKEAELRKQSLVKRWKRNGGSNKKGLKKINKEAEQVLKKGIVYIKRLIDILFGNLEKKSSKGVINEREMNQEIEKTKQNIDELLKEGKDRVNKVVDDTVGIQSGVNELLDQIVKENRRRWSKWFVVV